MTPDQLTKAYEAGKREQASELEAARAEIERLKTVPMRYRRMAFNAQLQDEVARLEQENDQLRAELAAEQANNTRLRDFIASAQVSSGVCCCGEAMDGHSSPMSCGHSPVDMWDYVVGKLLDAPSAISALEAYVAKAGEKMRTDAMQAADANNQFAAYDAIRTLPPVTLEDLK